MNDLESAATGPRVPRRLWDIRLNRREALERISAGTLLALGLWPGAWAGRAKDGARTFRFIAVNDTHYMSQECGVWLEGVVRKMKAEQPEFCLLSGDLTEHGRREDLAAVRDVFGALGVPTYVQIGNHDYCSDVSEFEILEAVPPRRTPRDERPPAPIKYVRKPSPLYAPGNRQFYEELFPNRLNYWFAHSGWQFVGLDSSEGRFYQGTDIQPHTLRWVDEHRHELDPHQPTVIFTHFPLGPRVTYRPANADALLDRFRAYNLRAVFSGHFHGFTERHLGETTLTTDKCCALKRSNHDGTKEKGFFVCEAGDGQIRRRFVECPIP